MLSSTGKILIIAGIVLILAGIAFLFWGKIPFLVKLPGDILIERGNFRFYFPLTSGILISLILTVIINIIFWLFR